MKNQMKFINIVVVLIILLSLVGASLNLNPTKIYLSLNPNEENCQKIFLSSQNYTGTIKVRDIWTNNLSESNLNKYTLSANDLGVTINYPKQFDNFKDSQEVEVCLSSINSGNYRGALIFTPQSNTNVIVEIGTWLFLNVSGSNPEITNTQQTTEETQINTIQTDKANPSPSSITGNVVSEGKETSNSGRIIFWAIVVIIAVILLSLVIYYIKRRIRWQRYGY